MDLIISPLHDAFTPTAISFVLAAIGLFGAWTASAV